MKPSTKSSEAVGTQGRRGRLKALAASLCAALPPDRGVFVERLWKSVKYEEVYLRAYESVPEARTGLGRYFEFYNAGRPHSSLGGMTPDQFFDRAPAESAAA